MEPMFLPDVEAQPPAGLRAADMERIRAAGAPLPQIFHLLAYKPDRGDHLLRFTHAVMRGPSPLSAGQRELIAAFTSRRNQCLF
jgi:alkylhydroperoxidase family enzyme